MSGYLRMLRPSKPIPKLEANDFRIDSSDWLKKTNASGSSYLEHPEGGIWELTEGKFAGCQLFTWDAAFHETDKVGKRLPSLKDWLRIVREISPSVTGRGWSSADQVSIVLGLVFPGNINRFRAFNFQGTYGTYWSRDSYLFSGRYVTFTKNRVNFGSGFKHFGYSVRCLAE